MNQVANNYKWGVLLWLDGQNEDQMYANGRCKLLEYLIYVVNTTPDFEEFLEFLGKKIVLKDWNKFRGGLDIKST